MQEKIKPLTTAEYYKQIGKDDKSSLVNLSERKPIDFIPSGSWVINSIIGDGTMQDKPGGFPRGHITEIFGDESSGKTTLALSTVRECQKLGLPAVFLDYEYTFHPGYAQKLGIDLSKEKFILYQPDHFQQGARIIKDAFAIRPGIICVDSVSAMIPKEFLEGEIDEGGRIGLQAQLMSAFLAHITKYLKESNVSLIFLNQMRNVIQIQQGWSPKGQGPQEESSGGKALRYYSSVRLKLNKGAVDRVDGINVITGKKEKLPQNVSVYASVIKNKIDKPYKRAPFYIKFAQGIDNIQSIIELAVNLNVIKKSGAQYTFTVGKDTLFKVQGKRQVWDTLNTNEKIFSKLQERLIISEDKQIQEQYGNENEEDDMEAMLSNVAESYIDKKKKQKEEPTE